MINKRIKTIVIEDEPLAQKTMQFFLSEISSIELVGKFLNAEEALDFLKANAVELIITDINLPNISGLELVESLVSPPMVIVTTAYPEYAVNAFNLDIVDYLLKPITKIRLLKAINKVLRRHTIEAVHVDVSKLDPFDYIFVKSEYKLIKINIEDILYLKAMGDYVQLITSDRKIMTLQKLKYFQENLPSSLFHKIHRSYIVAVSKIKEIQSSDVLIENDLLPISDQSKAELLKKMKDFIF